jgi:D-alanine-D-alanine ligase
MKTGIKSLKKIGILMGGTSSERDVSLKTSKIVLKNLDPLKYTGFPIYINSKNNWFWPKEEIDWTQRTFPSVLEIEEDPTNWNHISFPHFSKFPFCDLLFIGLHGTEGEDGRIQGFLDLCKQPYTGSNVLGSAQAMDKIQSKTLLKSAGIPTADFMTYDFSENTSLEEFIQKHKYPLVLKDPKGGSSIGVYIVKNKEELDSALTQLKTNCSRVLCEEFIKGREATCGFINNYIPLPATEIIPTSDEFFNYEAKYDSSRAQEVTPGNFNPDLISAMQRLSHQCHILHNLSVYSRTDFIIQDNSIFVLEINNLPGLTEQSLLPQGALFTGLDFTNLLSKIIDESFLK